jgi:hypothetical protein
MSIVVRFVPRYPDNRPATEADILRTITRALWAGIRPAQLARRLGVPLSVVRGFAKEIGAQ